MLTPDAVAYGGAGADIFVISAPAAMDHPDTLLGTVVDFNAQEGDRLVARDGELAILGRPDGQFADPDLTGKADIDQRVEIDFNGDGRADGYVLITAASSHVVAALGTVELEGFSSGWIGIVG